MNRIDPLPEYIGEPCSIVGIGCATGQHITFPTSYDNGYMTLRDMNKIIRQNCSVKKRIDYKRGERPLLKDLHIEGKALVCVYGHFIYIENENYWSFFDNENDEVVSVWILRG